MQTRFSMMSPWLAGGADGVLPVQVIALAPAAGPAGQAALRETLSAVLAAPVARRVLASVPVSVFDTATSLVAAGPGGTDWGRAGFDLIGQRTGDLGERMAGALADAYAVAPLPMLLLRADTLAVTPGMLAEAARSLLSGEADAAFGPAADGGFWLVGLHRPDRSLLAGLPPDGAGQRPVPAGRVLLDRLAGSGLRVALAPRLESGPGAAVPFSALPS